MDLQEVKKQLPNGAIKEIAQRAKLSTAVVSQFLNGKAGSRHEYRIMNTTAEYLAEYKTKEKEAKEALQKALSK